MSEPRDIGDATFDLTEVNSEVRPVNFPDVVDGRYRVVGRVGAGGMGVVLRAEDLFLERPIALKIIDQAADADASRRFLKEAQALAQVRHENVVQVYAFGPFQASFYLAMELVIGESLDTIIDAHSQRGMTIPLPRAMEILRAVARGLEAVHSRQLVHRDVKPGNIIIEATTDRPVLIDFGLARRRSKSNPKMSITGGTPSYMAPEQARGPSKAVTARSDLYAFACTAYELFTGRPVFDGDDIYAVMLAHVTDEPPRLSALRPDLAPLDGVLRKALSKEPTGRHASVAEFMTALDEACASAKEIAPLSAPSRAKISTQATVARPGDLRTLVLASDGSLRRSLVRNTTNTMRTHGRDIFCETAESPSQALSLLDEWPFDLAILDEESAGGTLAELVRVVLARNPSADLLIVSRDLATVTRTLGEKYARHLVPKPVNTHVLAAVLGRTSRVSK